MSKDIITTENGDEVVVKVTLPRRHTNSVRGTMSSSGKKKKMSLSERRQSHQDNSNKVYVTEKASSETSLDDHHILRRGSRMSQSLAQRAASVPRAQSHRETRRRRTPMSMSIMRNINNNKEEEEEEEKGEANLSLWPKRCLTGSFRETLRYGENYRVLILGDVGVGKSALAEQFQTSNAGRISIKVSNIYGDNCKRADDAQLTFFESPSVDVSVETMLDCFDVDAYVIVYSVADRYSFRTAKHILQVILTDKNINKKAAILVGNKVDLVRVRVVTTEEGQTCAMSYGCKFIETSDWIEYNVSKLFQGILAQIRLRLEVSSSENGCGTGSGNGGGAGVGNNEKKRQFKQKGYKRSKTLGAKSWGALKNFINKFNRKVKSCDNLHVI